MTASRVVDVVAATPNNGTQIEFASLDTLSLTGMVVDCVVGVTPPERRVPQPLAVALTLHLDLRAAARSGRLRATVDYGRLAGEIRFVLRSSRFLLLEEAAEALAAYVLAAPRGSPGASEIERASIRLAKPWALTGMALPSVTIHRHSHEMSFASQRAAFGRVETLFEAKSCGLYRLCIEPGATATLQLPSVKKQAELVLHHGLVDQGEAIPPGSAWHWDGSRSRSYTNTLTDRVATLLVVLRRAAFPMHELAVVPDRAGARRPEPEYYYEWIGAGPDRAAVQPERFPLKE